MRIDSIKHFIILAESGSFYQAAARGSLTSQGYHRILGSLEDELGVSLMERSHSGLKLTPEGKVFLEFALTTSTAYSEMLDRVYACHSKSNGDRGLEIIPIYCTDLALQAASWASFDSSTFTAFRLIQLPFKRLIQEIGNSQDEFLAIAELCETTMKHLRQARGLSIQPLYRTQIGIVTLKGSSLAQNSTLLPEDISDIPIALPQHAERTFLIEDAMGNVPFNNVQLVTDNEKMRFDYVRTQMFRAAVWDSFTLYLMEKTGVHHIDDLTFTPLDSPSSNIYICALSLKGSRFSTRTLHHLETSVAKTYDNYPDYFERFPLNVTSSK